VKYVCLVYMEDHTAIPDRECIESGAGLRAAGRLVAAEALQPTSTARTVRIREGRTIVTDGPFAETKEHLAGFYLIDAPDFEAEDFGDEFTPEARAQEERLRAEIASKS
jgi:hypothetical protein